MKTAYETHYRTLTGETKSPMEFRADRLAAKAHAKMSRSMGVEAEIQSCEVVVVSGDWKTEDF